MARINIRLTIEDEELLDSADESGLTEGAFIKFMDFLASYGDDIEITQEG